MLRLPRYRLWIWWVMWALLSALRPLLCRWRIEGMAHIPDEGGAVVACNHTLGLDYLLLSIASPRELHFMAKAEAFEMNWLLAKILRAGGVFPVQRGGNDVMAIDTAVERAQSGCVLGMFPEGTRSRTEALMRGKTGVARIALAADVPVIPTAVINAPAIFKRRSWRRPLVTIRFGPPVQCTASDFTASREDGEEIDVARAYTDHIMYNIAALLPPAQHGVYAQGAQEEASPAAVKMTSTPEPERVQPPIV